MKIPDTVIRIAVCCREWPVALWAPIGRCGYCGERPEVRRDR